MKKAERKRVPLVANVGDLNRPLRVRPVRVEGREWWAVDAEDTWPGMVMDLRRLGFESMAMGEEVLVRESSPAYEPQMDGPAMPTGLKPFPTVNPTISVRKESYFDSYSPFGGYSDEDYDDDEDMDVEDEDGEESGEEDEFEPEDLDIN